jgi:chromate reductase, NAD(P)H dehydrogenase (quinone)
MKILALSGSLRADSSTNSLLQKLAGFLPGHVTFQISDAPGKLPHFNDAENTPESVQSFRHELAHADAVVICTPEYAFGIPGTLKNALDWTVGSGDFVNKPVSLITASLSGERGHAALLLVLEAISAKVIPAATLLIGGIRAKIGKDGNFKDPNTESMIRTALDELIRYLETTQKK